MGGSEVELDPLIILLDFLVGDSVDTLAQKNGLPSEHVEQALRSALASYGFQAESAMHHVAPMS
jgi:hypothetical protein